MLSEKRYLYGSLGSYCAEGSKKRSQVDAAARNPGGICSCNTRNRKSLKAERAWGSKSKSNNADFTLRTEAQLARPSSMVLTICSVDGKDWIVPLMMYIHMYIGVSTAELFTGVHRPSTFSNNTIYARVAPCQLIPLQCTQLADMRSLGRGIFHAYLWAHEKYAIPGWAVCCVEIGLVGWKRFPEPRFCAFARPKYMPQVVLKAVWVSFMRQYNNSA